MRPGKHPNLFKIMYKNNEKVWNNNTHLSVNLKTQLRSDRRMKTGKGYPGVLQLDEESVVDEYLCRDAALDHEAQPARLPRPLHYYYA